jgi:hypothetical protein
MKSDQATSTAAGAKIDVFIRKTLPGFDAGEGASDGLDCQMQLMSAEPKNVTQSTKEPKGSGASNSLWFFGALGESKILILQIA